MSEDFSVSSSDPRRLLLWGGGVQKSRNDLFLLFRKRKMGTGTGHGGSLCKENQKEPPGSHWGSPQLLLTHSCDSTKFSEFPNPQYVCATGFCQHSSQWALPLAHEDESSLVWMALLTQNHNTEG